MHPLSRAWRGWKWFGLGEEVEGFRALLTLTYAVFFPVIAVPHKLLADPLRTRNRQAAFADSSGVDRVSPEAARRQ